MQAAVTGATGFIGSAVVRALRERGVAVRALVEPRGALHALAGHDVEVVRGSVDDQAVIEALVAGCDQVYHLAAIYQLWMPEPRRLYEINVGGTETVMLAAWRAGVARIVHTSSIAAVGTPRGGGLADEGTGFRDWAGASDYVRSKWLSEESVKRFARAGLPAVIVNPSFPFGIGDTAPTPTGSFVVEALAGRVPGYPRGGFNAVDVDDVAACHLAAAERGVVGERYLAAGHNVTYKEFYRLVTASAGLPPIRFAVPNAVVYGLAAASESWAELAQRAPRITRKAAQYATGNAWFDNTKMRALGVTPTPLRTTIDKAVAWFRAHGYGA